MSLDQLRKEGYLLTEQGWLNVCQSLRRVLALVTHSSHHSEFCSWNRLRECLEW